MAELLNFVILGLAVGALYALTAQGLVIIYRGSGVVNFAQGGFAMVGAFLFYRGTTEYGWSTPLAWVIALAVPALIGVVIQYGLMTRLAHASSLVRIVATLGTFFLLMGIGIEVWGENPVPAQSPLPNDPVHLFGSDTAVGTDRLLMIVLAIVGTAILWAVYKWTPFGRATGAVAENPVLASSVGLAPNRIAAINWAIGAALAAVSGILLAPILFLSISALAFTVLRSLAAALFGRFQSFWRTLVGAFGIGVIESLLGRYVTHEGIFKPFTDSEGQLFGLFTAQAVSRSAGFLCIIVIIAWAGRSLPLRSDLLDRLPSIGTGRINWPLVLVGYGVTMVLLLFVFSTDWTLAAATSMAVAIVCLSIVLITGYVGQLSLAQMSLAGFGAWAAGRLAQVDGMPVLFCILGGALVTVLLGILVALPALRTRGINLAIVTFGLAVVVVELVLANPAVTGGLTGTPLKEFHLFGINFGAFDHPDRYAAAVATFLLIACVLVANLRRGVTGRRFISVRDNERAASALGMSVAGTKLVAFAMSAFLAGLGGALLAFQHQTLDYGAFSAFSSIEVVIYTVIGGVGFVLGPLLAAPLAGGGLGDQIGLTIGFSNGTLQIIAGVTLLVILVTNPDGLGGPQVEMARKVRDLFRKTSGAAAAKPTSVADVLAVEESESFTVAPRALTVENLRVQFGPVVAVDNVSFEVKPGEILGLIGPNGAGKTTVLDAISGLVDTGKGSLVSVGDKAIHGLDAGARARAGLGRSFQSLDLFDDLTVRDNILAACDDHKLSHYLRDIVAPRPGVLSPSALQAAESFGFSEHLDAYPDELPYGTRRLLAIARAAASSPSVLLLDEPAAGLNEFESDEVARLVRKLAREQGMAVLVIEHDMSLVVGACDSVVVLNFGAMIASGPPREVMQDRAVMDAYLGAAESEHWAEPGTVPTTTGSSS